MLHSAFLQSEKSFDQNVQIALQNVGHELLKQNIEKQIVQNIDTTLGDAKNRITIKVDKNTIAGAKEIKSNINKKIIIKSEVIDQNPERNPVDSLRKSKEVNKLIESLLGVQNDQWTKNKIDRFNFEAALRKNLAKLNLPGKFEYAVKNHKGAVVKKSGGFSIEKGKIYENKLLRNALFTNSGTLLLYFNSRRFSILSKILIPLCLSILFLLVASGLFVYIFGLYKKQKQVSEARDDFINSMSHELKTPLATIGVSVENLKYKKEQSQAYLNIIEEENMRMRNYIDNILHLAQMDETEFTLNTIRTNLVDLVSDVVEKESIRAKDNGGQLKLNAPKSITMDIDPLHFKTALHNLIDNALKYNTNKPNIIIELFNEDGQVTLSISDNGQGIEKKSLSKIFDKFYRGQTGNIYNTKGTGIGLSYVKHIVEQHGGRISVKSELGIGSIFTLNFANES